jgi:cytidylate kinase
MPQLISMDGPAASGKSSVGSLLARRLGFFFFDTGIMYRAITCKAIDLKISLEDENELCRLAASACFAYTSSPDGRIMLVVDGVKFMPASCNPRTNEQVSVVAKVAGVRRILVSEQQKLAARGKLIMAGRDIGTVVLPQAKPKFFLTASAKERARRRYLELSSHDMRITFDAVLADLLMRDELDTSREVSPLKPAADAVIIDTEGLSLEQVVNKMYDMARGK